MSIEKLATGVPGLDELLRGGLPKGRATLIAGKSGTCKSITSMQILCSLARSGKVGLFVSVEETPKDMISVGDDLGFGASELIAEGALHVLDFVHPMAGPIAVSGTFDSSGLIHRLVHLLQQTKAEVVVIDSMSALFSPFRRSELHRHQFFSILHALRAEGATAIVTVGSDDDYGPIGELGLEDYVCDLVLKLRNVVDGKRRRRSVEVHKYRRSGHLKGEYPCAITRHGLSVFPLDVADESLRTGGEVIERYSTGTEGLDSLTQGGWLRDSIVLVRGPTGSGKTLLSGVFALAGAARGERVFYYGFEETQTMLVRNFESVGLDASRYIEAGTLKLISRFPESTSPEDMVIELRSVLTQYKPSLIVLDSISAIEHVVSYASFRQLMIGVTSALRQHGRSALLTQAVSSNQAVDEAAPYLSTMADAIVQLGYDTRTVQPVRSIRVYKMRGAAHDLRAHAFEIGQGGIQVHGPLPQADLTPGA